MLQRHSRRLSQLAKGCCALRTAQGYLAKLGLAGLVSAGMVSVNVLVGSAMQVPTRASPSSC